MSDTDSMDRILAGLLRQTDAKQLRWQRSVEADEFLTAVDTICVNIRCHGAWSNRVATRIQLRIVDDEGSTVEIIQTADVGGAAPYVVANEEQARMLSDLYVKARKIALNTQETLQKLAHALEVR